MGKVKGILAIRTCEGFRDSTKDIWSNIGMIAKTRIGNLVQFQLVFIFPALSYDIMTIVTHPCGPQVEVGSLQDQVTCWFTGLANQGIAAMVLMQIRSGDWLAYWISKPRNYSNGANADQVADWLTGLANQEITAMVLMQTRWLVGLLD
ncbi:hypothetical protein VNO77_04039 [Canavalia gladiata]|uniref:Uncharacterized protein n=1 Tax=Canavalia gladiata TaxID=3824 RepID=A0AAN9N0Z9_CANGL